MKNYKSLFVLFLSGLLFISATSSSTLESEINQFIDLFVKRWNQHNAKELSELWAENGDLINPSGEWEKGKSNVIKILSKEHQSLLSKSQMKQEVTNIVVLGPSMVWVDAKVKISLPGVPEADLDHHIVYLLEKQNNQWRILAARPYQFLAIHLGPLESPRASQ